MGYQIIEITNEPTGAVASKYEGFFGGKYKTKKEANKVCNLLNWATIERLHYIVERDTKIET